MSLDETVTYVSGPYPRGQDVFLIRDHGCQPTAQACMAACRTLGIHRACTSHSKPKGTAATERLRRTLKEACLWRQEWTSPFEWVRALATWIETYNNHDRHSAPGYRTPRKAEMEYHNSHSTPFVAA